MKKFYIILIIVAIAAVSFWHAQAQIKPPTGPGNLGCVGGSPNGKCETAENRNSCIADCAGISSGNGSCGNSACDIPNDLLGGCMNECSGGPGGGSGSCQGGGVGNGICEGSESISGCPQDCECDNDSICDAPKENKIVCPSDCGCNHNGVCEKSNNNGFNETTGSCSDDCGWGCNSKKPYYSQSCNENGVCEPDFGENFSSCKKDCGLIYKVIDRGDAVQNVNDCNTVINSDPNNIVCNYDGRCGAGEQYCPDCTTRSGISGNFDACNNNGICESNEKWETCCDCSNSRCDYDGKCDQNNMDGQAADYGFEDWQYCPSDCPNYCNNNGQKDAFFKVVVCDYGVIPASCSEEVTTTPQFQGLLPKSPAFIEDSQNCRSDVPCNNDNICEPNFKESSTNCANDCSGVDCSKTVGDSYKIVRCDEKESGYSKQGGGPFNCKLNPPPQCDDGKVSKLWLQTGCNYDGICQPGACEGVGNCSDCNLCGDGACSHGAGSMKLTDEEGKEIAGITYINWRIDRDPLGDKGTLYVGETPANCYKDCYVGDRTQYLQSDPKICNWQGSGDVSKPETTDNSPIDCECNADGKCDPWEGPKNCRSDCVCNNDGICESGGIALPAKPVCDDNDPDPTKRCGECYKGVYIHYPSYPGKISAPMANSGAVANFGSMSYGGSHWAMDVFALPCWREATGTIIIDSSLATLWPKQDCFESGNSEKFFEAAKKYCETKDFGTSVRNLASECKSMAFPWYFSAPNNEAGVVVQNDFTYRVGKCSLSKEIPYYCNGQKLFTYQEYSCPVRKDAVMAGLAGYYPSPGFSQDFCPGFEGALRSFEDTTHNIYSLGTMSYIIGDSPEKIKNGGAPSDYDIRLPSINLADYLFSLKKNQCDTGKMNPCDNDTVCEAGENFYNCYYDCACPAIRNYQFGFIYQPRGCLSVKEKPWDEQLASCRKDCGSCGDRYCQKEEEKYSLILNPTGKTPGAPTTPPPPPSTPMPPCLGGVIEYTATRKSDNAQFLCGRTNLNIVGQKTVMLCQNCLNSQHYLCADFGNATGTCNYSFTDADGKTSFVKLDYTTSGGDRELVYKEEAWCAPGDVTCAWKQGENGESCPGDCMPALGVEAMNATSITPYSADLRMKIAGWGSGGTPGEYWFEYWEADTDSAQAGEQQGVHLQTSKLTTSEIGTTTINVASLKNNTLYYFTPYIRSKFGSDDSVRELRQGITLSFTTLPGKCGQIVIDSPNNNSYVYPDESTEIKWHYVPLASGDSGCDNHFRMQILDLDNNSVSETIEINDPADLGSRSYKHDIAINTFTWGNPKTNDRPYQIIIIGYSETEDDITNPSDLNLIVPKLPVLKSWTASGRGNCKAGNPFINYWFNFENYLPDNPPKLDIELKLYSNEQLLSPIFTSEPPISGRTTGVWTLPGYPADSDMIYYLTAKLTWHGLSIDVPTDKDANGNDIYYKQIGTSEEPGLDNHLPPLVGFTSAIDDGTDPKSLVLHAFPYPPENNNISQLRWYLSKEDYQSDPKNPIIDVIDGVNDWWLPGQNIDLLKTGIWLEAFDGEYWCNTSTIPDNEFRSVNFREESEF